MREIKFRAWSGADKTMDYFSLFSMLNTEHGWCLSDDGCNIDIKDGRPIMQYTGLKDKNGTEIYEGDIIDFSCICEEGETPNKGTVVFKEGAFIIDTIREIFAKMINFYQDEEWENYKVIGNIYEQ